jgi:hypothetical protein
MNNASEPLPGPLDSCWPDIADLLCEDIMARKEIGIKTYGKPLRAFNGRPALWDLLAELLDAAHYTRQRILEDEAHIQELTNLMEEWQRKADDADGEDREEWELSMHAQGVADGLMLAVKFLSGKRWEGTE